MTSLLSNWQLCDDDDGDDDDWVLEWETETWRSFQGRYGDPVLTHCSLEMFHRKLVSAGPRIQLLEWQTTTLPVAASLLLTYSIQVLSQYCYNEHPDVLIIGSNVVKNLRSKDKDKDLKSDDTDKDKDL